MAFNLMLISFFTKMSLTEILQGHQNASLFEMLINAKNSPNEFLIKTTKYFTEVRLHEHLDYEHIYEPRILTEEIDYKLVKIKAKYNDSTLDIVFTMFTYNGLIKCIKLTKDSKGLSLINKANAIKKRYDDAVYNQAQLDSA